MDGKMLCDIVTTNSFTKSGLLPESEHSFRVRTVKDNAVSDWSDVVKGKTIKAHNFSECIWKECPDYVDEKKKYSVDEKNTKIASMTGKDCTIIGNTLLPPNKVTSWNIKILKSRDNDGYEIYIGVAPSDINQSEYNYENCGWYFNCYYSTLHSGHPHSYKAKIYGPRKGKRGEYVHTGDSVGVIMDTIKGELLFILNGVNFGVAYEGIPLDKPLVPCVITGKKGDSIELII